MIKRINNIIAGIVILCILFSCKRDNSFLLKTSDPGGSAYVKVFIGAVNANRNYVYADNNPWTGAPLVLGTTFPGNVSYAAITPGTHSILIKDTLPTATQVPLTFSSTFDAGKYYTIFTYDTLNNVKYLVVTDNIVIPDDTTARVRFANLIFSSVAIPNVDVFSKNLNQNVFTNIAPAQVTDFLSFPSKNNDSLFVRATGTATQLAVLSFTPDVKRSYTLVFKGRYQTSTGTATTSNPLRSLTFYTNR